MIIPTHEEIAQINDKAELLEKTINSLLFDEKYDQIVKLFEEPETNEIVNKNQNIYILQLMICLIDYEIKLTGKTSLKGKDTTQLIRCYRIISLFLRRLEFDFPLELQRDIIDYMRSEGISEDLVIGIISVNPRILQKQKVTKRVNELAGEIYE